MNMNILGICLYALLGGTLSASGVSVEDHPYAFFGILAIVWAIDLNATYLGRKSNDES